MDNLGPTSSAPPWTGALEARCTDPSGGPLVPEGLRGRSRVPRAPSGRSVPWARRLRWLPASVDRWLKDALRQRPDGGPSTGRRLGVASAHPPASAPRGPEAIADPGPKVPPKAPWGACLTLSRALVRELSHGRLASAPKLLPQKLQPGAEASLELPWAAIPGRAGRGFGRGVGGRLEVAWARAAPGPLSTKRPEARGQSLRMPADPGSCAPPRPRMLQPPLGARLGHSWESAPPDISSANRRPVCPPFAAEPVGKLLDGRSTGLPRPGQPPAAAGGCLGQPPGHLLSVRWTNAQQTVQRESAGRRRSKRSVSGFDPPTLVSEPMSHTTKT